MYKTNFLYRDWIWSYIIKIHNNWMESNRLSILTWTIAMILNSEYIEGYNHMTIASNQLLS